ncbi:MAG TPA: cupin domain-containing protein [Aliidongia sp.]|nr:cupin domain-containing protein [Aliidongia sp.]
MNARPDFIKHYTEIEEPEAGYYEGSDELFSIGSPFGRAFGLTRIGIHHETLAPGRRTSLPHAESLEEEFVYVLEGTPDVWIDGVLHRLQPGDGVGFPAGTGIAHSFLNNTGNLVRLLVAGERSKPENKVVYPVDEWQKPYRKDWWEDAPEQALGPHDGKPALD